VQENRILLIGSEGDRTYRHTKQRLRHKSVKFEEFNLNIFYASEEYIINLDSLTVSFDNHSYDFKAFSSIYHRLILDENLFGELGDDQYYKYSSLICLLNLLFFKSKTLIINVPSFEDVNSSKIDQLINTFEMFDVPQSICTSDQQTVKNFVSANDNVIYKSCSSMRSIVQKYDTSLELKKLKYAPCLFQEEIVGFDVRVHVIDDCCFAEKIVSNDVDYRYSEGNRHFQIEVSNDLKVSLIKYCRDFNLRFIGADFKINEEKWFLLEINTMPGYSGYDDRCDFSISNCLIELLTSTSLIKISSISTEE
jgi:hypothetical protein